MAGDWIKVRKSVLTHPRLVRTMSALKADKLRTLGGLVSAWCLFDEQTTDGKLLGYTPEIFDEMVGLPGLARAMAAAGWLEISEDGLQAPEFEKHNGATAKRRAQDSVRKMSARDADKCPVVERTKCGPEKRREEKRRNIQPPVSPEGDAQWIESLKSNPAYAGLDVAVQLGRAQAWAATNRRQCSRKFFINWLNRADRPMTVQGPAAGNHQPERQHASI